MADDFRERLRQRRIWFLECQARGLNLDTFRNLSVPAFGVDKDALQALITEPFAPLEQVYLDSGQPVWTADELGRREALADGFLGRRGDWLELREPHRLRARLRALADAYAGQPMGSGLDPPITATEPAPPRAPAELHPVQPTTFVLPQRKPSDGDGKGQAVSRAMLAETKPWLLGELFRVIPGPKPGEDPTADWLANLEGLLSGIEDELHVSTGGGTAPRPTFKLEATGPYAQWAAEAMQRGVDREASAKAAAEGGRLRTTSDAVSVRFLQKKYPPPPTGGPPHPRPKAPNAGGRAVAPVVLPYTYTYDIEVGTAASRLGKAADYRPSYLVRYWNWAVRDGVKEVYVNNANSDMGLCLLVRTLYLFGTIPQHLAGDADLRNWRIRTAPPSGGDFDGYFDRRSRDPYFQAHADALPKLRAAQERLRILLQANAATPHAASLVFSPLIGEALRQAVHHYKFWLDEPLHAVTNAEQALARANVLGWSADDAEKKARGEMEYWSENHYLMFASCEYLVGQLFEFDEFQPGKEFLDPGATDGVMSGARRKERGRARVLKWLNHRMMFGWTEFHSSGYYREHLWALLNLADFAMDTEVRTKAALATDLLLFDLARYSHQGSMAAAGGRCQFKSKNSGWDNSAGDAVEILFGTRGLFGDTDSELGAAVATSRYEVPEILAAIATDPHDAPFTDRSRVSIHFDEAYRYGIDITQRSDEQDSRRAGYAPKLARFSPFLDSVNAAMAQSHNGYGRAEDSVVFWWTTSSYINKQVVTGSLDCVARWGLEATGVWSKLADLVGTVIPLLQDMGIGAAVGALLGGGTGALIGGLTGLLGYALRDDVEDIADEFSVLLEGSSRTRANVIAYSNGDAMLSSMQNFRPGQVNYQSNVNQATLSRGVNVFTTAAYPGTDLSPLLPAGAGALLGGALLGPLGAIGGGALALGLELGELEGENLFGGDETDGPSWWTGHLALPMVVQHRGAAIIAYQFHAVQEAISETQSHAWFPTRGFDGVAQARSGGYEDDNMFLSDFFDDPRDFDANGHWVFGRLIHADPEVPAADRREAYVGVFSNKPPKWLSLDEDGDFYQDKLAEASEPAKPEDKAAKQRQWARPLPRDYFAGQDWSADGANVWIVQVGSKAEFGDFEQFMARVRTAKVVVDDAGDLACTYHMPLPLSAGGGSEALSLDYEDGGVFHLGGTPLQTDLYPRFESPYVRGGRVEWGQRSYVLEHRGKRLLHDFHDFAAPVRTEDEVPDADQDTLLALVLFARTTDEEMEEETLGTVTVRVGCHTVAEDQIFAVGPVTEHTDHDAEWLFLDGTVVLSPDLTLTLAHSAFGDGDPDAEWSLRYRLRALMADHQVRDCMLWSDTTEFTEDDRRRGPVPFAVRTDRWRHWASVPEGQVRGPDDTAPGVVVVAARPPWRHYYYDHCDLLHAPPGRPVRHRRVDACLSAAPWSQLPAGPDGPARAPDALVRGYSRAPGDLTAVTLDSGRLFAASLDGRGQWSPWAAATELTDGPVPAPVPFARPGMLSIQPSTATATGADVVATGADGHLYVNGDWRPDGIARWQRVEVDGFTLRTDGDCARVGDQLFALGVDGSLWSARLDALPLLGLVPQWTKLGLVDHPVRGFTVIEGAGPVRVLAVTEAGWLWDVVVVVGSPSWTLLGSPSGQPVAAGTQVGYAIPEDGRLDVFVTAGAGVHARTWTQSGWQNWVPVGVGELRVAAASPLVVHRVNRQVEVLAQSELGELARTWWS